MTKVRNAKTVDQSPMVNTAIFVFAICGYWCPLWWPSRWNFLYHIYFVVINFILITHVLSELINLTIDINTLIDFIGKCLSVIPVTNACCKGLNILIHRRKIISVLNMLDSHHCKVRNLREIYFQQKYERLMKWINITFLILAFLTVTSLLVYPFVSNSDPKELPFKAWFPFAVKTEMVFWIIFVFETIAALTASGLNVANDLIVVSIILEICRQLDMLSGRLINLTVTSFVGNRKQLIRRRDNYASEITEEGTIKEKLVDCVAHHIFIFHCAEATHGCFVATFATQMVTSMIGTCTSAYHLSRYAAGSPDFNKAGLMLLAMLSEIFLYCWFGNELRLKSLEVGDAVYKMNWFNLKTDVRKDLMNICMRARKPIIFRSVPTASLSTDVFITILRTSYSVFALLRRIEMKSSNAIQGHMKTL